MNKYKTLIQYTVVFILTIIVIAFVHAFLINRQTTDKLIKLHVDVFPDIIRQFITDHPSFISSFNSNNKKMQLNNGELKSLMEILQKKDIFRFRLFDHSNHVIWSNIKKNSEGKKDLQGNMESSKALSGIVSYKLVDQDKTGNGRKTFSGEILKIYIPVIYSGKIIGVAELHKQIPRLELYLYNNKYGFWYFVIIIGIALFASLFFIFLKANRTQSVILKRLEQTQDVTIFALAYQAELHDNETGKHLDRTAAYVKLLAEELSSIKKYRPYLTAGYIADLVKSAPLHDIGKVGIPDSILKKPGPLSQDEFAVIKKHCEYSVEILEKASSKLSFRSFLNIAIQIAGNHHEKWDGSGYPKGLSGEAIPLSGRIMALADAYDAMRTRRVYKDSFQHDKCIRIITEESGKHFDPDIVNAFLRHEREFLEISEELGD